MFSVITNGLGRVWKKKQAEVQDFTKTTLNIVVSVTNSDSLAHNTDCKPRWCSAANTTFWPNINWHSLQVSKELQKLQTYQETQEESQGSKETDHDSFKN